MEMTFLLLMKTLLWHMGLKSLNGFWNVKSRKSFPSYFILLNVYKLKSNDYLNYILSTSKVKINHFKTNNIMVFSMFTVFCSYHLYLVPKCFIKLKGNLISIKLSPSSHPPKPLICFVSEFIYKWNHTVCDLLCLTSFAQHTVWGLAV